MPLPLCWNTLTIDGVDIRDYGVNITSAEGLLTNAPQKGDLIEQDWQDGALWQKGPKGPFSFDVPVVAQSRVPTVALGQIRELQALVGDQHTVGRRLTVNGEDIEEFCEAVLINSVEISWDFRNRPRIDAVLVWQALSEWS